MELEGARGDGLCLLMVQTRVTTSPCSCFGGTAGGDYRNWGRGEEEGTDCLEAPGFGLQGEKHEKGRRVRQQRRAADPACKHLRQRRELRLCCPTSSTKSVIPELCHHAATWQLPWLKLLATARCVHGRSQERQGFPDRSPRGERQAHGNAARLDVNAGTRTERWVWGSRSTQKAGGCQ